MRRRLLATPKFSVPLAILLWLMVSLSLWLLVMPGAGAQSTLPLGTVRSSDPDYNDCLGDNAGATDINGNGWAVDEAFVGTWGMDPRYRWSTSSFRPNVDGVPLNPGMDWNRRRLKLLTDSSGNFDACYRVRGHVVYGERWGSDYDWETGYDEDMTFYLELDDDQNQESITTRRQRDKLRRYAQARKVADIHIEHVPRDQTSYYDRNTLPDGTTPTGTLNTPCLDWDIKTDSETGDHCTKNLNSWDYSETGYSGMPPYDADGPDNQLGTSDDDPGLRVEFIGAFVYDANYGFREIHPVRKQKYTENGAAIEETAPGVVYTGDPKTSETCQKVEQDKNGNYNCTVP
jgi:hypothetical protein